MKRNFKDMEKIIELTGSYDWNGDGKILITKTDTGFEVNKFAFKSIKAACDFVESFYEVSMISKGVKEGARIAKDSAKEGVKFIGTGICWIGNTLVTIGASIKNGMNK